MQFLFVAEIATCWQIVLSFSQFETRNLLPPIFGAILMTILSRYRNLLVSCLRPTYRSFTRSNIISHIILCTLDRKLNMNQSLITRFFTPNKSQSANDDSTPTCSVKLENQDPSSGGDDSSDKTPSKPVKRPAEDDKRDVKRVASASSPRDATITKDQDKSTEPSDKPVQTPEKQPGDTKIPSASPLIDTRIVIRRKISTGAFALHENIGVSWFRALQGEFDKAYFKKLSAFVKDQRLKYTVFPPEHKVYSWTHHKDIKDVRVVILGQDPYHGPNQAHGLSFSVPKGVKIPPSLVNIYKELENDIKGFKAPPCGDLTGWAKQGVLLLNTCLTVNQGQAFSHQNKGWETFTDAVITWISSNVKHEVVFMLWGRPAQRKMSLIDKRHKILTSAHPSPLSAYQGFMGCQHFSKANQFLREQGMPEIDWKDL